MSATTDNAQAKVEAEGTGRIKPIDIGFRCIDGTTPTTLLSASVSDGYLEISIELNNRPNTRLELKVTTDTENQTYAIRNDRERVVRRVSTAKIPCDKTKKVKIELVAYRREYLISRREVRVLSEELLLEDDELYTETRIPNVGGVVTITFAYTPRGPGAELRARVENARKITDEQKVVLDGIRRVHRFFEHLDVLCNAVKEIHPFIEAGCNALLLLYKLCEKHRACRTAARALVDEMSDLLTYEAEAETFRDMLRVNSYTKAAFESIVHVIKDISEVIRTENKGTLPSLFRDAFSKSYESKLKELKEKLTKAKEGLRASIAYGMFKRMVNADLRAKLESVSRAHYSPGEGCLENTRKVLLADVDIWLRGTSNEKTAWVYGRAGSGKSALLNSIAEKLEKEKIPFTYFPCKRDDPDLSDIHKILTTIAYIFTELYGDYGGFVSNLVDQLEGRSILTGGVKKQLELLFGEAFEHISPEGANRPPVHVILIDALDECRNHRDGSKTIHERRALIHSLIGLADAVPWIKVLITSRPETDIVEVLTDKTSAIYRIDINADNWETSNDIRLFIEAKSDGLKLALPPDQVNRLNEMASGLFVWCATVFRYIEGSKRSKKELIRDILHSSSSWPDGQEGPFDSLYALYRRVLDSAVVNSEDRSMMKHILGVIFVASDRRPLSANAIADILYSEEESEGKREWVNNIVESLSAIVYVEDETKAVRACHPSVLDFTKGELATSSNVELFPTGIEQAHARVFDGCFTIMKRMLRFNMCQLDDSYQLNEDVPNLSSLIAEHIIEALQYACLFWLSHLEQSGLKGSDAQVLAFLNSLKALFWVEALSLMNVVDWGIVTLQDCARFFTDQPSVAELASEWERFLLAFGDTLKSTPHLYLSALSWLPGDSRLWDIVRGSFSSELPMIVDVPAAWNRERWSENVGSMVYSVAYSADGRLFAAGCKDGRVRLWDARSGKAAREPFETESEVKSIAFSGDDRWLASGHKDHNIRLWDLDAGSAEPRVLDGHTDYVNSVGFSTDSKRIVSCSHDHSIRVWNVESGTAIGVFFTDLCIPVNSVTFSADNIRIISGHYYGKVCIWNSETGEQVGEPLYDHSNSVDSVACSRDGKFIASGSFNDGIIILRDAQTYERIGDPLRGHTGYVSVCFSADSKLLASGSDDHSVRIWDVETRSLICDLRGHTGCVYSVAFSQDGQNVLSGSHDGTVRIWHTKETAFVDQLPAGNSPCVSCVSYVPNSCFIASASRDGSIHLFDANTGAAVGQPMQGHTLAISNTGQWLVSVSFDSTLRIWDINSRAPLGEPFLGHTCRVTSVAASPDNQLVASASDDKTVHLWDLPSHEMTLEGHESDVTCVMFSVDGNRVISGSVDCTIRLWDTRTGEAVGHPLEGHTRHVTAVAVSPDGQWFASASSDGTVRIWSVSTLSVVHVLQHYNSVLSVAFSGDSRFLISGSWQDVMVWNAQTGEAVGDPLSGHAGWIHSIAFSPYGHEFASGSDDGTIRIWDARVRTDLELYREDDVDYAGLDEEASRICWNTDRASLGEDDDWIKDEDKLLLWVPVQYRRDIKIGLKLVIEARGKATVIPKVDYRKLFKFTGARWKNIYRGSGPSK